MKDFLQRNKVFLIVSAVTIAIIVGGVFLMSGGSKSTTGSVIDSSILAPEGVYKTAGYANGTYLPGNPSAKVTLVEFGDYECPACGIYAPYVKGLLSDFSGNMNYVFRNYPLPQHKNAFSSSYAVEAAGLQAKFWEMHEKVFTTQAEWSALADPKETFVSYAKELGLDTQKFSLDMDSQTVKDIVTRDTAVGNTVRITETPTFYVNGRKVNITSSIEELKTVIREELDK